LHSRLSLQVIQSKRFILSPNNKRHPAELGAAEVGGVFDAFGGGRKSCAFNVKSGQGGGIIFVFEWFVNF